MLRDPPGSTVPAPRPLAGARGLVITDGKIGMDVQAVGVAEALGLDYEMHKVAPRGLYRLCAPYGPVDPSDARNASEIAALSPPWPSVAIATGRLSIPYLRALKRRAGAETFAVVLQDPKTGPKTADLIWVPEHDRRRGANVITTLTAPHGFSPQRLARLRASPNAEIEALPGPRVAVILGGKNAVYKFTDADDARFARALSAFKSQGASFMVTPSRRTHQRLLRAAMQATEGAPRILWDGTGANPYPAFLAAADLFVVTADSVNMAGEACATGKPVYVFSPSGGSPKFDRFHAGLVNCGATRPLPDVPDLGARWTYTPLDSASMIASEIESRWARRRHMLSGLVQAHPSAPQVRPSNV